MINGSVFYLCIPILQYHEVNDKELEWLATKLYPDMYPLP